MEKINLEEYEPLVQKIARKYHKSCAKKHELDDILQAGRMGLVQARNKFDVNRGVKFITYATSYIEFTIVRWLRDHGATIKIPNHIDITNVDIELPVAVDSAELINSEPSLENSFSNIDLEMVVESLLETLDTRTNQVIKMYYLEHKTLESISEEMEVSSQRVHQILSSGLKKLKDHMISCDVSPNDLLK